MASLALQSYMFLVMVLAGVAIGLLFDLCRVVRLHFRGRGFFAALTDAVFWLLATAIAFTALMVANWGDLRLYSFLGLGAGFFLYLGLGSPLTLSWLIAVARAIQRCLRWCGRVVRAGVRVVRACADAGRRAARAVGRAARAVGRAARAVARAGRAITSPGHAPDRPPEARRTG